MQSDNLSNAINAVAPQGSPAQSPKPSGDLVFRDKPKKNIGMIVGMIILAMLAAGGIGFGVWAYLSSSQKEAELNSKIAELQSQNDGLLDDSTKETVEVEEESGTEDDKKKGCEGVYYGESAGTSSNGLAYDLKYTYTLNSDGTFSADFGETSGNTGVFLINGNTISLIGEVETGGLEESAAQYSTKDYFIAEDCSYIIVNDGNVSFTLNKQ